MVGPPVVVTLELEDHLAARRRADEADCRLRRLGAGRCVPELLEPGDEPRHELPDLTRQPVREGDVDTGTGDRVLHGLPDEGWVVSEEVDSVAAAVVEVLVAVGVADAGAGGRLDHEVRTGAESRVARFATRHGAADPLERIARSA